MAQNDPDPNKSVRICSDCSYKNDASLRRCLQCGKSLAGASIQSESLSAVPLLLPPANETSTHVTGAGIPPDQFNTQPTLPLNQIVISESGQSAPVVPIPLKFSVSAPLPVSILNQVLPGGNSSRQKKTQRSEIVRLIMVLIALLAIAALLFALLPRILGGNSGPKSSLKNNPMGLGEFKASNGELLGVNDGSSAPFLTDNNGQLKQQAADQLKQGHRSQAISLWRAALHITNATTNTNNDAEVCIYIEDQLVLLSGVPYLTLVAGTDLLEKSGSGLNDLQGIYVAQHEVNSGNHGFRIRILIANSGTDINNVTPVAQRIVNIANQDKTVVGVISWLSSAENITALSQLAAIHLPMISPAASSDELTGISPSFFRIVPPNNVQGKDTALFAEHALQAKSTVVFVDNHDPYSQNLAQDFEKQFRQDGKTILKEEPFTKNHTANIKTLIEDAKAQNPDLLYFTSPATSDVTNFQDALTTSSPFVHMLALAGDAGYVAHNKAVLDHWYFASFAFANVVDNLTGSPPPPFYQDYINDFNSDGLKQPGYYGYTRPDDISMLSYDVTSVFLKAMQQAISNNKIALTVGGLQLVTPALLAKTLPTITLLGVSGSISFDAGHDPVNKAIVFLATSTGGIRMKNWQGCFTQTICQNGS